MKTRTSLVSNSSSSSFICRRPVIGVARDMWNVIATDSDYKPSQIKKYLTIINKICKRKEVQSGKYGISLPSCNYDTDILVVDGACRINSSWNHDWSGIEDLILESEEETQARLKDKYFYHIVSSGTIVKPIRLCNDTPTTHKLICNKCKTKWGLQDTERWDRTEYHYQDIDGDTYCPEHFTKLTVAPV
jgi:hypothetical protein